MSESSEAITRVLSAARLSTYQAAADDHEQALALYMWNAEISAAFMVPLHICEVSTRNGISEVLTAVYGDNWPRSAGFVRSLTDPPVGFNPTREINTIARNFDTTGKVIPELKFVFWQRLFTRRNDGRLWTPHLLEAFPHLDASKTVGQHRGALYQDLEIVRRLRNRIAHHEPIFSRDLTSDLATIRRLIAARCVEVDAWLHAHEGVTQLIADKP